jgi:hypothetical protein
MGPRPLLLMGPRPLLLMGPKPLLLMGPKPLLLMDPKPLLLEPIHTRSIFIISFVSDKPWNENVLWLPFPPHIQTQPSTGNKTDHHNILNPTNCNQHLYIIIVIPQRTFQVHVVLILLHCMPFVNL